MPNVESKEISNCGSIVAHNREDCNTGSAGRFHVVRCCDGAVLVVRYFRALLSAAAQWKAAQVVRK